MESTLLHFNSWVYYGAQPLVVLKFPFWWGPVNALIVMSVAACVYRLDSHLGHGWRQLQIVPIVLTANAVCNAAAGWPSWFVINSTTNPVLVQAGGILSCILAGWFMSILVKAVAKPAAVRLPAAGFELAAE